MKKIIVIGLLLAVMGLTGCNTEKDISGIWIEKYNDDKNVASLAIDDEMEVLCITFVSKDMEEPHWVGTYTREGDKIITEKYDMPEYTASLLFSQDEVEELRIEGDKIVYVYDDFGQNEIFEFEYYKEL